MLHVLWNMNMNPVLYNNKKNNSSDRSRTYNIKLCLPFSTRPIHPFISGFVVIIKYKVSAFFDMYPIKM